MEYEWVGKGFTKADILCLYCYTETQMRRTNLLHLKIAALAGFLCSHFHRIAASLPKPNQDERKSDDTLFQNHHSSYIILTLPKHSLYHTVINFVLYYRSDIDQISGDNKAYSERIQLL